MTSGQTCTRSPGSGWVLKLLSTSLHYRVLLSHTYHWLSLMADTTIISYLNLFSGINVLAFVSAGTVASSNKSFQPDTRVLHLYVFTRHFDLVLREGGRLTDWGGQMTIQVWDGANPNPSADFFFFLPPPSLKVVGGRRVKGVIPSPRGAIHSGRQAKHLSCRALI